jgi:hypothetical protein
MCGSGERPPKPSANGAPKCPADATKASCPLKQPHLVELVEVVTRSKLGVVVGAGAASPKLSTVATRTDKTDGGAFKQYINLDKDLDGADKRHPEYGRFVELRARVEGEGSLSGLNVEFKLEIAKAPHRPAGLSGGVAEGFGSAGGAATTTSTTDAEGWTGTVQLHLSQYAGDSFKVVATLTEAGGGQASIGSFEVWRKFWYQHTRAASHTVPAPAKSVAAYKAMAADLVAATEVTYEKSTAPAQTFYPGWMVAASGGDSDVSVIGSHNKSWFQAKYDAKATEPVKGHLIMCQYQWDHRNRLGDFISDLVTVDVTSNPSQEITVDLKADNAGIVKPALSGSLVALGTWKRGSASGAIADADIVIEKTRGGLNRIKVKLPSGAPDPTTAPVQVKLKLRYGKFYGGESTGKQMLIVYRGVEATYVQTVSHEFGHGFGLTGTPTAPLTKHAKYYDDANGGQGPHCSTGATEVASTSTTSGKLWTNGTCIMFHKLNPTGCTQLFCSACEPLLRLRAFTSLT